MGSGKPLISVVVPVYKAEPYLRQCVDSLLAQSCDSLEILLVDDGSPDASGTICDAYAAADGRVKVLHQANQGVSAARNAGTAAATGAYIAFVDADDWVEPDYLEYLLGLSRSFDAQIAVCGCALPTGQQQLRTGAEALETLLYQKEFDTAPWGKLFSAEIAKAVPFPEGMYFEDLAVVCRMFGRAERVACARRDGYHYRQTPDGTMRGGDVDRLLCQRTAADMMVEYVSGHFPALAPAAECRRFSAYCQVLMKLPSGGYEAQRGELWRYIKKVRGAVVRDRKARAKNRLAALISCFGEGVMQALWKAGQ